MVSKILKLEKTRLRKAVTMSIPEYMLRQLDEYRGDVSRSRYISRIIEAHLHMMNLHVDNEFLTT